MAESGTKFTPKKRQTSCMQSSDDGGDTALDDLCRKKFKPIAPKPYLKKDGHQSMLTTVLPVKTSSSSDRKDIKPGTDKRNENPNYGDVSSMPVMYGGPVFIPVRFPFPVLVPAMFNVNANQQQSCTCGSENFDKDGDSDKSFSVPVQSSHTKDKLSCPPCPVHYSYNPNQPTYINSPVPNLQSSFLPVYPPSSTSASSKPSTDWPGKPKYSRYKYSMLKNGDIYKGRASNIQNYQGGSPFVGPYQVPSPCVSQFNQYSSQISRCTDGSTQCLDHSCSDNGNCCSASCTFCPPSCGSMCQTSAGTKSKADAETQKEGFEMSVPSSTASKLVQVDAAVQTDTQPDIETNQRFDNHGISNNNGSSKLKHSSGVQCALESPVSSQSLMFSPFSPSGTQTSQSSLAPVEHSENAPPMRQLHVDTRPLSLQGASTIPHGSASNSVAVPGSNAPQGTMHQHSSLSAGQGEKNDTVRNYSHPASKYVSTAVSTPHSTSGAFSSHNRNLGSSAVTESESSYRNTITNKSALQETPPSNSQRSIFSTHSESTSEALQQRHYETDVIVPLRAAPSPSDSHNVEDMDRFVLSPVVSESDAEDIYTRENPSSLHGSGKETGVSQQGNQFGNRPPEPVHSAFEPTRFDHQHPGFFFPPHPGLQPYQPSPVIPNFHINSNDPHSQSRYQPSLFLNTPSGPHSVNGTAFRTPDRESLGSASMQDIHGLARADSHLSSRPFSTEPIHRNSRHEGLLNTPFPSSPATPSDGATRRTLPYASPAPSSGSQPQRPFLNERDTGRLVSTTSSVQETTTSTSSRISQNAAASSNSGHSEHTATQGLTRPSSFIDTTTTFGSPLRQRESSLSFDERAPPNVRGPDARGPSDTTGPTDARSIQSVPLHSNVNLSKRGNGNEDSHGRGKPTSQVAADRLSTRRTFAEPTHESVMESPSLSGRGSTNQRSVEHTALGGLRRTELPYGFQGSSLVQPLDTTIGYPPNRNVSSSAAGYPMPYGPPLMCRSTVPPLPLHDSSAHHLHGLQSRPLSGSSLGLHGSVQPHPTHNPHALSHNQHSHLFYPPHYGSIHQPLNVPSSPGPSHPDLSLLSPRSCAHLHFHNNMLHSPQLSSPVHGFQRTSGFAGGIHGSYPYPYMEERLETCCPGRCIHSPQKEDRSLPTLFSNILHRRPGAFSHFQQKVAEEARLRQASQNQYLLSTANTRLPSSTRSSTTSQRPSDRASASSSRSTSQVRNTPILPKPAATSATLVSASNSVIGKVASQSLPKSQVPAGSTSTVSPRSSQLSQQVPVQPHPASQKSPSQPPLPQSVVQTLSASQAPPSGGQGHKGPPTPNQSQVVAQTTAVTTESTTVTSQPATPNIQPSTPSSEPPLSLPLTPGTRIVSGNTSDKYLPVELVPPSPAMSTISTVSIPEQNNHKSDQVVKYGDTVLKCSRQILRESGRTVLCCWNCDYHTAEPRKMHRHQKKENQPQKCQLCDFKDNTRCKVSQHYKEVHMNKDDPFRSVAV